MTAVHFGSWGVKVSTFLLLVIATFFLPNTIFDDAGYASVARVFSSFFLILQVLILIDFAYEWNDAWLARDNGEDAGSNEEGCCGLSKWESYILSVCLAMYILSFVGITLLFVFYSSRPETGEELDLNLAFMVITVIGIVVTTGVQMCNDVYGGNLLASSIVGAYCTYLCWSACASNPMSYAPYNATAAAAAGPTAAANGSEGWQVLISLVFTGASLAWTTAGTSDGLDRLAEEASPSSASSSSSNADRARNYAPIRTPLRGDGADDEDSDAKYDDALMIEEESLVSGGPLHLTSKAFPFFLSFFLSFFQSFIRI